MAAAGLLSLGLLLGPRIAMAWMLVQQENRVQQEIVQVYQHHFPSMRQQTNIKYHFGQNMKKQHKGVFLQLDDLEQARQAVPALEISLLEYDAQQNALTLSVSAQKPGRTASRLWRKQGSILISPYSLFLPLPLILP